MVKAGMPQVAHPGQIQGADRQHPAGLEPREDEEDIRQYDQHPAYTDVPVRICGIPGVKVVPAIRGMFRTVLLNGTGAQNAENVLGASPKIRRFYLMANTNPIWVGTQEQVKAATPNGGLIPVGVWSPPFEGFNGELWAVATVGASSLTVREEYWAD